ncbi:MAG: hypothetical protein ACKVOI_20630 [Dongiaceae bacterium]
MQRLAFLRRAITAFIGHGAGVDAKFLDIGVPHLFGAGPEPVATLRQRRFLATGPLEICIDDPRVAGLDVVASLIEQNAGFTRQPAAFFHALDAGAERDQFGIPLFVCSAAKILAIPRHIAVVAIVQPPVVVNLLLPLGLNLLALQLKVLTLGLGNLDKHRPIA